NSNPAPSRSRASSTDTRPVPSAANPNISGGLLGGVRVIDLTRVLGGPYCTQILGDHGADVIKVEPPTGDETRSWGPPFKDGLSAYYAGANRNKRVITLDLKSTAGRDVLLQLLKTADVLIHNMKPGTLERWDLNYDTVLEPAFPRLIVCEITGFGANGPFGGYPGYDAVIQALSGLMSVNGDADSGPMRMGIPIVDLAVGLTAANAIAMALFHRETSQRGQRLDVSLYDVAVGLLHPHAANYLMSGREPQRTGNSHPNIAPYDLFDTSDGPIFVAVGNDRQFASLCAELGIPQTARDARFAGNADRVLNRVALHVALQTPIAAMSAEDLTQRLLAAGVPAGAVRTIPQVLSHEQTHQRQMVVETDGYRGIGIPIKSAETPGSVRHAPTVMNADADAIYREFGLDRTETDDPRRE
ncbi:MAG: CoA transferase, partial [Pseudomonadota bacterium]